MRISDWSSDVCSSDLSKGDDAVARTHTECTNERVVTNKDVGTNSVAGTILGGVAGGVIGHPTCGGHGQVVDTTTGARRRPRAGNMHANIKFPDQAGRLHKPSRAIQGRERVHLAQM